MPTQSRTLIAAALIAPALLLTGCIKPVKPAAFAAQSPAFRPEQFFGGTAHGSGFIQSARGRPARQIRVLSKGTMLPDGRFRLDQTITQSQPGVAGEKLSSRHWIMTRLDDRRYTATLSDAAGPVTAEVQGNVFHLRYLLKKPFVQMEQWLYLQPDGKTVLNEGTISMPGRIIARLSEVIVRE